jgi:hypothetical protein
LSKVSARNVMLACAGITNMTIFKPFSV